MGSNVVVQHHTGCSFTQCRGITSDAERTSIAFKPLMAASGCDMSGQKRRGLMKKKQVKYITFVVP